VLVNVLFVMVGIRVGVFVLVCCDIGWCVGDGCGVSVGVLVMRIRVNCRRIDSMLVLVAVLVGCCDLAYRSIICWRVGVRSICLLYCSVGVFALLRRVRPGWRVGWRGHNDNWHVNVMKRVVGTRLIVDAANSAVAVLVGSVERTASAKV